MSRSIQPSKMGVRACVALVIGLIVATLGVAAPSYAAAPEAPSGLNVDQPIPSTTKFNWNRSEGAERYEIQVDDDPSFSSPEVNTATVNSVYVPEVVLKPSENHWRVRAMLGTERSTWSSGLPFSPPTVSVPIPSSPTNGAHLQQPGNPPLLSWTPSPGAKSYTIQVDSDSDFVGVDEYTTETTSLVVSRPLGLGDWFWRVIASKGPGVVSQPSSASSFWIDPLKTPVITGPLGSSPTVSPDVMDVVLDWDPVPGAVGYELQVAGAADFTVGSIVEDRTGASKRIFGTKFSPPITYDNNGYYWRVRAVDPAGNSSGWASSQVDFNRHYDRAPELVYPADGATSVPDPLYFDWKAVTHASEYEIWVGTDEFFSPNTYNSCRVAATSYTPGLFAINDTDLVNVLDRRINEDCDPAPGKVNYWRVRPLDRPYVKPGGGDLPGVQGLWSPTQSFTYTGLQMNNLRPSHGATVDIPTLSWDTAPGALTYRVEIQNGLGNTVDSATTHGTSYTPKGTQRFPTTNNPYTWRVYAETAEGTKSLIPQRQFRVTGDQPFTGADPLTPLGPAPASTFTGPPSLTWEPHPDAAFYRVHAHNSENILVPSTAFGNGTSYPYAAMTDTSSELKRAGTYTWWVTAHSSTGHVLAVGPDSTFQIRNFAAPDGHKVALGGRAVDSNNPGQTPCTPTTGVCTVPATPVLKWDREPGTAFYMVYVSEDPSFSNLLEPTTAIPATTSTMYTPALDNRDWTYADNQTERPYYWFVRPCRAVAQCGPGPVGVSGSAQHTFFKKSPPVTGLESAVTERTEVSFDWDNYWHDPESSDPADKWQQTGEALPQSAMKYRIEIATDSSFSPSSIVESAEVDQTTFTSTARIYPTRTYWWRVQAIDSDGNGLTWSTQEATFVRSTPPVTQLSPVGNGQAPSTTAFRWEAQPYARAYNVEVFKNDDSTFSTANRVASGTSILTTAYTWNKALAPSATAYRWRVQRVDASGNLGDWSDTGRFFVTSGTPNIVAPAAGALQAPNGPVLEWEPLAGAASYTVTITPQGVGSNVIANTVSTAWAATAKFASGTYNWSLAAKDASGNTLGTATSSFEVNAVLEADQAPAVLAPHGTAVGDEVQAQPPVWAGHTDVTNTYQWLRDGAPISGATGTSYVLQAADYNKMVSVKATGTKPNFAPGSSTSDGVLVGAGNALVATSNPVVSGSATVGSTLFTTPGTWNQTATGYRYQWLRNGVPIEQAATSSYRTVTEDIGLPISVRVYATRTGYADGEATSSPIIVVAGPGAGGGGTETGGAVTATSAPVISGTPSVGAFLSVKNGTWNPASGVMFKYQWLRDGAPIPGAVSSMYRITEQDIAHTLSVVVVGTKAGMTDGAATSAGVVVPKVTSITSASAFPTTITKSQRAKLTIRISASGLTKPTGKLLIKDGRKTLAKTAMKASNNGVKTYKLPRLKVGKHKIKVIYKGSSAINKSKSKIVKIVVRKK